MKTLFFSTQLITDAISSLRAQNIQQRKNIYTKISQRYLSEIDNNILDFLQDLNVKNMPDEEHVCLTNELAKLSGAEMSKRVIAFKLAYISAIRQRYGIVLPIIIDTPGAKELDDNNYKLIQALLQSKFKDHQIIIATINLEFSYSHRLIIISDGLLDGEIEQADITAPPDTPPNPSSAEQEHS